MLANADFSAIHLIYTVAVSIFCVGLIMYQKYVLKDENTELIKEMSGDKRYILNLENENTALKDRHDALKTTMKDMQLKSCQTHNSLSNKLALTDMVLDSIKLNAERTFDEISELKRAMKG